MKQLKLLPLVCFLVLALNVEGVHAVGLEYYGIEDIIMEDLTVMTNVTMAFSEPIGHLDYWVGDDFSDLIVSRSFDVADCSKRKIAGKNFISCDFAGMTGEKNQLEFSFQREGIIRGAGEKFQLSTRHGISMPIETAFIMVRLPENGILAETPVNSSYFPQDGKMLTDGRYIMVYWEYDNLESGKDLEVSVLYGMPQGMSMDIMVYPTLFIIIAMFGIGFYVKKTHKPTRVVTSVLNKDEKAVVGCLRNHEGKAGQKVIVRETDFSKAKVSRLVKGLNSRGVVGIEPISGRENRIILKIGSAESEENHEKAEKDNSEAKGAEGDRP